jgi:hypothetical protein
LISNLYISPLILLKDIVSINRLTLVLIFICQCDVSINRLTQVLISICQCDIKHIMMLPLKTSWSRHILSLVLTTLLVIMSVSTFMTSWFVMFPFEFFACNNICYQVTSVITNILSLNCNMKLYWCHFDKSSMCILSLICFTLNGLLIASHFSNAFSQNKSANIYIL